MKLATLAKLICSCFLCVSALGCAVTQTGNPSGDPDDGGTPDASNPGFDPSDFAVLPGMLNDPGTSVRFSFNEMSVPGTLRIASMSDNADAIEIQVVPGSDVIETLPAFVGDWVRLQLFATSGPHMPLDMVIGEDALVARSPSCLDVPSFVRTSEEIALDVRNNCDERLDLLVRVRSTNSPANVEPNSFALATGSETSIAITETGPSGAIRDLLLAPSTGPPERTAAVTVLFD